MEKLIELLNEYETPRSGVVYKSYDDYDGFFYGVDCDGETEIVWSDSLICSKKFGFIKWLDENNKIDCNKSIFTVDGDYGRDDVISEIERQNYYILNEQYGVNSTDCILMLLSISDTPIEDLISYLK